MLVLKNIPKNYAFIVRLILCNLLLKILDLILERITKNFKKLKYTGVLENFPKNT